MDIDFIIDKFYLFFQGLIIFQCLFFTILYFFTKKKDIGYYALYLLISIIYFFLNAVHTFFSIDDNLVFSSTYYWWVNVPLILLFTAFYVQFIKTFLDGTQVSKKAHRIYKWTLYGLSILFALHFLFMTFGIDNTVLFILSHIIISVYGISATIILWQQKMPYTSLVSFGIIVNILGGTSTIVATILGQHGVENILTVSYPIIFMRIGILIDLFLYQMAIFSKWYYQEKQSLLNDLTSKLALTEMKVKISRDLHDDIGSTLSHISMQTDIAQKRLKNKQDILDLVESINTSSKEMLQSMSDIVWSLNPTNENTAQLIERIQNLCAISFPLNHIEYEISIDENIQHHHIKAPALKEIYLIMKEAINNCLKYAQCTHVTIRFTLLEDRLFIGLQDNGKGFDILTPQSSMGGTGLRGMQARASSIQATLSIVSNPVDGTAVNLLFPFT